MQRICTMAPANPANAMRAIAEPSVSMTFDVGDCPMGGNGDRPRRLDGVWFVFRLPICLANGHEEVEPRARIRHRAVHDGVAPDTPLDEVAATMASHKYGVCRRLAGCRGHRHLHDDCNAGPRAVCPQAGQVWKGSMTARVRPNVAHGLRGRAP